MKSWPKRRMKSWSLTISFELSMEVALVIGTHVGPHVLGVGVLPKE